MEIALPTVFNWVGECPFWDVRTQELSLVDLNPKVGTSRIFRWNPITTYLRSFDFDQCASFNIPTSEKDYSVITYKNQVYKFDWIRGTKKFLFEVDANQPTNRLNDGKCDKQGALITATMSDELSIGVVVNPGGGSLFRYKSGESTATTLDTGFDISNGLEWNASGDKLFFADTATEKLYVFDYDKESSATSNKQVCIDFKKYAADDLGLPDGITMDINDHLWIACLWAGKVIKMDAETGTLLQTIKFPTACITSLCFGGPDLSDMYVTSAKFGVGNDPKKGIETAGSLFKIPASIHGTRGFPMNFFQT